jgi:hypothetical protein
MFDIFCMQITDDPVDLPAHTQYTRWNGTHLDTMDSVSEETKMIMGWF